MKSITKDQYIKAAVSAGYAPSTQFVQGEMFRCFGPEHCANTFIRINDSYYASEYPEGPLDAEDVILDVIRYLQAEARK